MSSWGNSWGLSWAVAWGTVVATSQGIMVFLGTWQKKPLKVWTGSAWVEKPVKRWTGTVWK